MILAGLLCSLSFAAQDAAFQSAFPAEKERVWIGPDYYANRLLDWRSKDGWLECREGSPEKPMRTVHLLTYRVAPDGSGFETSVRLGPLDLASDDSAAWAGFLVGVGGEAVDWRTSALVHHWPGLDGGLIAAIDGAGQLVFRENGHGAGPRGPRGDLGPEAWPPFELTDTGADYGWSGLTRAGTTLAEVTLTLRVESRGDDSLLTLTARHEEARRTAMLVLPCQRTAGGLALVSSGSPRGDGLGFAFTDWRVQGDSVRHFPERAFGPVLGTLYTLGDGVLKLTAQMGPIGLQDERVATLSARLGGDPGGEWKTLARSEVREPSFTIPFRVEGWDGSEDTPYRVEYELDGVPFAFDGTIRAEPTDEAELVLGALSCHDISSAGDKHWNNEHIWWPHADLVANLARHDPDVLFFAGDQIYEGGLAGIIRKPTERATLDYLYHWYRFVWAFRDLTRDRPTICLPDDHDVYHGNIWGAGGVRAEKSERFRFDSDRGGYMQDTTFVNAVHATQVSHLPDPVDPEPLVNGISVYFTRLEYAGVSFGIVADRMFKSSGTVVLPQAEVVNGWPQNPDFDPATEADVEGAELLGARQLAFLDAWIDDWSHGAELKLLLSQTIFHNVATIPGEASSGAVLPGLEHAAPGEYLEGDRVAADFDSNGWPQSGRDRAMRILRRGFGFHVAGDQHLPSFTQYGLDDWRDGPFAFCVPAIANLWPRRFFPPTEGANRPPDAPRYVGDHVDGFGNKMTVWAVANPMQSGVEPRALMDRNPGYGIVRLDKRARTITAECWPRWVDPRAPDARQFPGWPITVQQVANFRPATADARLPRVLVRGLERPVVQVLRAGTDEVVYSLRLPGPSRELPSVAEGTYDLRVGDPDRGLWQVRPGVATRSGVPEAERLLFEFE